MKIDKIKCLIACFDLGQLKLSGTNISLIIFFITVLFIFCCFLIMYVGMVIKLHIISTFNLITCYNHYEFKNAIDVKGGV